MTELHTNTALLKKLERAANQELSAGELRSQKISFIMGSLNDRSTVTRARVLEVLDAHEGNRTRA